MTKIKVGNSKINGKGLFSTKNIKKGEFVGFVEGKIKYLKTGTVSKALSNPNWIGFKKNCWYDTKAPFVYINHSCNPNTGIKGTKSIYAIRDIQENEELTFDYAISEVDTDWFMICNCREKNCRKKIKSVQNLPKSIFLKYMPYVPTYMIAVYKKEHSL